MLKEIRFKNWKSFGEATLYIDPLTVLIGTNASGKSNALDGIEFLHRIVRGVEIQSALNGNLGLPGLRGGSEWSALKPGQQFCLEALVEGGENHDYLFSITVTTRPEVEVYSESLKVLAYMDDEHTTETNIFHTYSERNEKGKVNAVFQPEEGFVIRRPLSSALSVLGQLRGMPVPNEQIEKGIRCVVEALENILILDPIPTMMRDYSSFSKTLSKDASNLAGVLVTLPKGEKELVEQTLSYYVTQLPERDIRKVWAEPVGRLHKDAMLYCEEEWGVGQAPLVVDAGGMSDGTLRFLGILTALLTRPMGSQIVIEEVDNGLHPSRASLLLAMLREIGAKRHIDVLVTTHNPALLDALGPDMVPFVVVAHRDLKHGQSTLTLLEDIQNLPKLLAAGPIGKVVTQGEIEKSLAEETGDDQ